MGGGQLLVAAVRIVGRPGGGRLGARRPERDDHAECAAHPAERRSRLIGPWPRTYLEGLAAILDLPMLKFLSRLADSNEREVRRFEPVVTRINALEPEYTALSDEALRAK